jgi:hypothetical protein
MANKEEFKDFYLSHTLSATAKHFNLSVPTIMKYAKKYGLRPPIRGLHPDLVEKVMEYYKTHSTQETATFFDLNKHTVLKYAKKSGLPVLKRGRPR